MRHDYLADIIRMLADSLEVPVGPYRAGEVAVPCVVVRRTGGRHVNRLQETIGLTIGFYGETELDASRLADAGCEVIDGLRFPDGYEAVEMDYLRSFPDPDSRLPRWTAGYTLTVHNR